MSKLAADRVKIFRRTYSCLVYVCWSTSAANSAAAAAALNNWFVLQ